MGGRLGKDMATRPAGPAHSSNPTTPQRKGRETPACGGHLPREGTTALQEVQPTHHLGEFSSQGRPPPTPRAPNYRHPDS